MAILISWSLAFDTILSTSWTFSNQIAPGNIDNFNLSLFAPSVRREFGWTAWNIAYNLALLGKETEIIASIGQDAESYIKRLDWIGVWTSLIKMFPETLSAHGFMISDEAGRQITAFHPGAMSFSWEISIGGSFFSHAIISPDSKNGMLLRIKECKEAWSFTIFDPGQAIGLFNSGELIKMVVSSDLTIMNDYEESLFMKISWETLESKIRAFSKIGIVTMGEKGSKIYAQGKSLHIPATFSDSIVDTTWCWDAYRWWLLFWLSEAWSIEKSCKLWSILGWLKIRYFWGQNHPISKHAINDVGWREFWEIFFS